VLIEVMIIERNLSYRDVGTKVRVTPRILADKTAALDLSAEDSRMHTSDSLPPISMDENGNPMPATEFVQTSLTAKINVPAGKALLATGARAASKSGKGRTLIVVGVRVIEAETKRK
jgi:type II secretory pathway component GspD/PulD (secretin)